MPQKGEDQTKTGILIGKIAVEGGQGLTGEDEAGVLGQPGVQEGSLLRLRDETALWSAPPIHHRSAPFCS